MARAPKKVAEKKPGGFKCRQCSRVFQRKFNLSRHKITQHPFDREQRGYACGICNAVFRDKRMVKQHRAEKHDRDTDFRIVRNAHGQTRQLFRIYYPEKFARNLTQVYAYTGQEAFRLLEALAAVTPVFKIGLASFMEMEKIDFVTREVIAREVFVFRGEMFEITRADFDYTATTAINESLKLMDKIVDEYVNRGSGWRLVQAIQLDVLFSIVKTMSGSNCYLPHICKAVAGKKGKFHLVLPMPSKMEKVECFKSMGKSCFYFAVAAGLMGNEKSRRDEEAVKKVIETKLVKLDQEDRAISLREIPLFEELNAHLSVAVNVVYVDEEGDILPVYASQKLSASNVVVLALFHLIEEEKEEEEKKEGGEKKWGAGLTASAHFALIEHPKQFFAKKFSKESGNKYNRTVQVEICWNCHSSFDRRQTYLTHVEYCHKRGNQLVRKREEGRDKTGFFCSTWMKGGIAQW